MEAAIATHEAMLETVRSVQMDWPSMTVSATARPLKTKKDKMIMIKE